MAPWFAVLCLVCLSVALGVAVRHIVQMIIDRPRRRIIVRSERPRPIRPRGGTRLWLVKSVDTRGNYRAREVYAQSDAEATILASNAWHREGVAIATIMADPL